MARRFRSALGGLAAELAGRQLFGADTGEPHADTGVDHAGAAAQVGMPLRPTELLIFGNPKGGTPLMQDHQTAGLDLPLKALAWEDADGKVRLTHDDAAWIAKRHGLGEKSATAVAAIEAGMSVLAKAATAR